MAISRYILRYILALALSVLALPRAHADAPSDALKQVIALARASAWADAAAALPPTADLTRAHLPLLWDAAAALRVERPDLAAHLYAAMRRLEPDSPRARIALENLWAQDPTPETIDPADLPFLPVLSDTVNLPASDLGPAAMVTVVRPKPFIAVPAVTGPREGYTFPRLVTVYRRRGDTSRGGILELAFTVRTINEADERLAMQAGRFLGALSLLSDRLLGPTSRARLPFAVWVWPGGKPGAEQWGGAIIVHRTDLPRSPLEWARELAHEWGHASLRGVDGFTDPEAWANGDMGERLYLPALSRAGWQGAWAGLDVAPYTRRYVDPLISGFARTGPLKRLLEDTGRAGYDHLLGGSLYIAAAYGTPALVASLDGMEGDRPLDMFIAFRRWIEGRDSWTIQRPPEVAGPAPICLPTLGDYILDGRNVRRNGRAVSGPQRFPAGWSLVDWDGPLTIHRAPDRQVSPPAPARH